MSGDEKHDKKQERKSKKISEKKLKSCDNKKKEVIVPGLL